jgi:phage head maturation protease
MRVTMTTPANVLAADTQARTMTGVVVPYGQPGFTSAGRLTVQAGALRVPDNLRHVKLFRDHDRTRPVGYASAAVDGADGLVMTFRIGATPDGDQALLEASEGLRDAFSVELDDLELDGQTVTAADLTAVAQVPVPAYQAARIATVAAARRVTDQPDVIPTVDPPQPLPPEDPDGGDPDDDDDDDDETTTTEEDPDMTTTATAASGPAAAGAATNRPTPTQTRARGVTTVLEAAQVIAARARGQITSAELQAALSDVTTAPASAGGILQPQWVGNLWSNDPLPRIHVDACTGPRPLTGLTVSGFVWNPGMTVATWAGDKAAIPSNAPKAILGSTTAGRWAGGVDIAREFIDLGTPEIIADLLATARDDYRAKTDADCLAKLLAGATDAGTTFTTGLGVVNAIVTKFTGAGNLSTLFVGTGVWASLAMTTSQAWMSGNVTYSGGNVGGVTFVVDGALAPGAALGLDKRAATFYEQGPITVEALNIAQGGIDEAVHGYSAVLVNKPLYVVKASGTIPPPVEDAQSDTQPDSKSARK